MSQEELKDILHYNKETGRFTWRISKVGVKLGSVAGSKNPIGYRKISINRKCYSEHRLAWIMIHGDIPDGMTIDHINRDPSDNRFENLRLATISQNTKNSKTAKNNTSGVKGVSWNKKRKTWDATIMSNRKSYKLGQFKSKTDAIEAITKKRELLHKEFACHQ